MKVIDGDKKVHEITKAERQRFAGLIKNVEMTVAGTRDYAERTLMKVPLVRLCNFTVGSDAVKKLFLSLLNRTFCPRGCGILRKIRTNSLKIPWEGCFRRN